MDSQSQSLNICDKRCTIVLTSSNRPCDAPIKVLRNQAGQPISTVRIVPSVTRLQLPTRASTTPVLRNGDRSFYCIHRDEDSIVNVPIGLVLFRHTTRYCNSSLYLQVCEPPGSLVEGNTSPRIRHFWATNRTRRNSCCAERLARLSSLNSYSFSR